MIDSDTNLQGIGDVKLSWDHLALSGKADDKNSLKNNELRIRGIKLDSLLQPTQWQDLAIGTQTLAIKEMALAIQSDEASDSVPVDGQATPEQDEKAQRAALTILAKKPELQFSPLAWSNSGGISRLTLDLGINFTESDSADETVNPDPLRFLSKFDFNAEIDKKMLQQSLTQIANVKSETEQERLTPEQITQEADEGYQHMLQLLTENRSFIETPEAFSAKALLENGQLKYNGEVVPQETIEQVFMTALFALGQAFYSDDGLEYDEDYANSLYDETDSEAAAFGEDDDELLLPSGEYDLSIPNLSPSDLQGLPPAMP
ncbi:DUF945 family protein [Testudinibacter sp. P80/BLE/0925]|uniref:DUF945 family protein n=1 Tax=Testudinibacter sp. TW-1 TaxID=3417757 RepID=UPI003D368B2A